MLLFADGQTTKADRQPVATKFTGVPLILNDGTPAVGEQLVRVNAPYVGLALNQRVTEDWLVGGVVVSSASNYTPSMGATVVFRNQIVDADGNVLDSTYAMVTVAGGNVPAPVFAIQPVVSPAGGAPGTTFTVTPGVVTNGVIGSRAWLLGTTTISTGLTATPGAAGTLTYQEFATGSGGNVASAVQTVTIAVPASPVISFANPTVSIPEGNSGTQVVNNTVNVVRNGASGDLTVNLAYSGTATAGSDYVASQTSVTIVSGSNSAPFSTTINGDTTVEPDETIIITASLAGYSATATKTITITNDDAASSPPVAQTTPSNTGTPQSGQSLTGVRGTYTNSPTGFADQWQQSTDSGSTWSNIDDATTLNFTPADAQVGKILRRVETASNASGSSTPSYTAASAVVAAASSVMNVLGVIDATPQANPTAYPPTPSYTFYAVEGGYKVGDTVRVLASPNFDRSAPTINDATYALTGNLANDTSGINAKIASIASGTGYVFVRAERASENKVGDWSQPVQYGTATIPALTTGPAFTVRSGTKLAATLTYGAPVRKVQIFGNDMGFVEVPNALVAGSAYTLRWLNDGLEYYEVTDDFNQDHIYDLRIRVTGLNGQTRDDTISVEVQYYSTTPNAFAFAPTTGAETNSTYVREQTAPFAGMASDYDAPISITGPFDSFRVYNGTSYSAPLTNASGVTVRNGYKIELTAHSSASYLTERDIAVTVGGVTATWALTTKADPTSVSPTFADWSYKNAPGGSAETYTVNLAQGVNVIGVYNFAGATCAGATSCSRVDSGTGGVGLVQIVAPSAGNYTLSLNGVYPSAETAVCVVKLTNAQAGGSQIGSLPGGNNGSPAQVGSGQTIVNGNISLIVALYYTGGMPQDIGFTVGTLAKAISFGNTKLALGYMTASGTPTITFETGQYAAAWTAVWSK